MASEPLKGNVLPFKSKTEKPVEEVEEPQYVKDAIAAIDRMNTFDDKIAKQQAQLDILSELVLQQDNMLSNQDRMREFLSNLVVMALFSPNLIIMANWIKTSRAGAYDPIAFLKQVILISVLIAAPYLLGDKFGLKPTKWLKIIPLICFWSLYLLSLYQHVLPTRDTLRFFGIATMTVTGLIILIPQLIIIFRYFYAKKV